MKKVFLVSAIIMLWFSGCASNNIYETYSCSEIYNVKRIYEKPKNSEYYKTLEQINDAFEYNDCLLKDYSKYNIAHSNKIKLKNKIKVKHSKNVMLKIQKPQIIKKSYKEFVTEAKRQLNNDEYKKELAKIQYTSYEELKKESIDKLESEFASNFEIEKKLNFLEKFAIGGVFKYYIEEGSIDVANTNSFKYAVINKDGHIIKKLTGSWNIPYKCVNSNDWCNIEYIYIDKEWKDEITFFVIKPYNKIRIPYKIKKSN